jgi:hypothetical protein
MLHAIVVQCYIHMCLLKALSCGTVYAANSRKCPADLRIHEHSLCVPHNDNKGLELWPYPGCGPSTYA